MPDKFVVSNADFVTRNFEIHKSDDADIETLKNEDQTTLDQAIELTVTTVPEATLRLIEDGKKIPITINSDENEVVELQPLDLSPKEKEEAFSFNKARSFIQMRLSKTPSTSIMGAAIDEMLDKTFESTEAVVASRLSYLAQVKDLVMEHEYLVNALLALAESFNVVLPSDKINYETGEVWRVNIPVTRDGCFNANELALITIHLKNKMKDFPETSANLTAQITKLANDSLFKEAQTLGLKRKIENLENIKPNNVTVFIIKRQDRERYLYLEDKKIKSSKVLTSDTVYFSYNEAEKAFLYAIKNITNTKVRKILNYKIIQLSWLNYVNPSDKVKEAIKNSL